MAYGSALYAKLSAAVRMAEAGSASIFGYYVEDPERFGIMEFKKVSDDKDSGLRVVSVEEKPAHPKSIYAIVGLYFYPAGVSEMTENVKPSPRGDLENIGTVYLCGMITDITQLLSASGRRYSPILYVHIPVNQCVFCKT